MKNFICNIKNFWEKHNDLIIFVLTFLISLASQIYFYTHGNQNLSDYDAIARLNIARKIIDSLTPGIGQLGGIWLPFPQILMIPFIWNNFLWHTGIAGSIVSGTAFILSAIYLRKTVLLLTNNKKAALLVWFIFVSDINLLLLQTMAMSESFFLFSMIMILYFLTKWVKDHDFVDFLLLGLFVTFITLTRYEGYFVFIGVFISVFLECIFSYWRYEGKDKVEGMMLVFLTVAGFGIFLWCLYCALFYKDPLYWLHVYSSDKGQVSTYSASIENVKTNTTIVGKGALSITQSFLTYSSAILWTNGIITSLLALFGFILITINVLERRLIRSKIRLYLPIIIISTVLFSLLVYGYQRGFIPAIEFPPITIVHLLSKSFNDFSHSNIRYGVIMAPLIFIFIGLIASRNKVFGVLITLLIAFQIFTYFYTPLFLYFSFPASWGYSILKPVPWFISHYDGGLILTSSNRHENFMFQTGLPYKDFIYEGSREYWTTSLNEPDMYATWILYDETNTGDNVTRYLTDYAHYILDTKYKLLYYQNGVKIYKLKDTN